MPAPSRSHTPKGRLARDRVVAAAERLFAARGFHGASLRDVAAAAKAPLASIVYHFAKKETLYAAVLSAIADELTTGLDAALATPRPGSPAVKDYVAIGAWGERIDAVSLAIVRWSAKHPARVRLLLRELLDNPARVARASRLPLAPVLERLSEVVAEGARAGVLSPGTPETAVLHLVGAISYFVAARPTVDRIVGAAGARRMAATYERDAVIFARRALGFAAPPRGRTTEVHHATRHADAAREARPRAHRVEDHRSRRAAVEPAGRRVRGRGANRA